MTWTNYRYASLSDAYPVTWQDAPTQYHASLRAGVKFGGRVGTYAAADAARKACEGHAGERR